MELLLGTLIYAMITLPGYMLPMENVAVNLPAYQEARMVIGSGTVPSGTTLILTQAGDNLTAYNDDHIQQTGE